MIIEIEIPSYAESRSLVARWDPGFEIEAAIDRGCVVIRGNVAGLRSLARHLLTLADPEVPSGHFHFDETNSLEDGSVALIFEKR
jgi:hypothetical protein